VDVKEALADIPDRILHLSLAALSQANMHAVFLDPGMEHRRDISILNAAHAGELLIKAIIAKEHPLLIFRDLFKLDTNSEDELSLESLIQRGKTYNFDELPRLLWATTGRRLPSPEMYERVRRTRNAIQHFCVPDDLDPAFLALEFIYKVIDPLLFENFGRFAIEYHEDHIGYDYVVGCVVRHELEFSVPSDFSIGEVNLSDEIADCSDDFKNRLRKRFLDAGLGIPWEA
jgi:hypothetical protein